MKIKKWPRRHPILSSLWCSVSRAFQQRTIQVRRQGRDPSASRTSIMRSCQSLRDICPAARVASRTHMQPLIQNPLIFGPSRDIPLWFNYVYSDLRPTRSKSRRSLARMVAAICLPLFPSGDGPVILILTDLRLFLFSSRLFLYCGPLVPSGVFR